MHMKRMFILSIIVAAIAGVAILKKSQKEPAAPLPRQAWDLPRLLDLGSKDCTACTMLEPVLEELRTNYTRLLQVDFIDVWEHEEVATDYGVKIIPVQIFFDADGLELYRHQGFISAQEIVEKFEELGVDLNAE